MKPRLQQPPSYKEICLSFGFPLPSTFFRFVQLAFVLSPETPWEAYEPIGLLRLNETRANPGFQDPGHDYANTPPEAYVFGWTGVDGGHFAFFVEDLPTNAMELPIVIIEPCDESSSGVVAHRFEDLVEFLVRIFVIRRMEDGEPFDEQEFELIDGIQREFAIPTLRGILDQPDPDRIARRLNELEKSAIERRFSGDIVATLDGFGLRLPPSTVDLDFLEDIQWPDEDSARQADAESFLGLLEEAERRLNSAEPGTALVLAKNFRFLFWYDDWKRGKRYISRTADIMAAAYDALGREHCLLRVRTSTEWAKREVS